MVVAVLGWLVVSGAAPISEQQLVRAGFPLMTPIDDTAHPLYLRYHHNQAGSGAAASVSGPYSREEAEEEVWEEFARLFD